MLYRRYGAKQHLHGRPIRFGYKMWAVCVKLRRIVHAEPLQGACMGNVYWVLGVQWLLTSFLGLVVMTYFSITLMSFCFTNAFQQYGHHVTGMVSSDCVEKAPLTKPDFVQ